MHMNAKAYRGLYKKIVCYDIPVFVAHTAACPLRTSKRMAVIGSLARLCLE
jgi:hypothetical protein